jgi:mannose-1-phosphate guanylyltransferase / phosphomannomutase
MMAAVKLMEYLALAQQPLSALMEKIPKIHVQRGVVPCAWEKKGTVMRRLIEAVEGQTTELIDGVKIWQGKNWVLILPDADKPFFHVDAEADSPREAQDLIKRYCELIKGWQS